VRKVCSPSTRTERDCTKWCKANLTQKLENFELTSFGECKVSSVDAINGEVTYCNRKRKHMFFYDIELKLSWKAGVGDKLLTGRIVIPSITDDDPICEKNVQVTGEPRGQEYDVLRLALLREGTERLIGLFNKFLEETRAHFQEPLPDEITAGSQSPQTSAQNSPATKQEAASPAPVVQEAPKKKATTKAISMKLLFDCSPDLMYECLLDDRRLSAFTQSQANMERTVGGSFSLFSGQITGTNKELIPNQKIVQNWRFKTWPADHHSLVTITLKPVKNGTEVSLQQSRVPSDDFDRTKEGWHSHFWTRIRGVFGFPFQVL